MEWLAIAVMPSLELDQPIECNPFAMVPLNDGRILSMRSLQPGLSAFLEKFYDTHGNQVRPTTIIWRRPSLGERPDFNGLCSFRDIVALAYVLSAQSRVLTDNVPPAVQWSDYFSIYPWMVGADDKCIVCFTPAIRALHCIDSFRGQTLPDINSRAAYRRDADSALLESLKAVWKQKYIEKSEAHKPTAVLRSANMAFRASSMPAISDATQYDFGRSIALWVSAFEILVHPGGKGRVELRNVYGLLSSPAYKYKSLSEEAYMAYPDTLKKRGSQAVPRNLPCLIYGEMCHARNDFIHGNPLPDNRLILNGTSRTIISFCPALYGVALSCSLKKWSSDGKAQVENEGETSLTYERALLAARRATG
ncbi:MAG: hypothetical protein EKK41_23860 [Hyphomicrobiales bacterium]|nr:MAG: hypothetical protein EKK41_23860 [Hyphomicrobiales bacterium]